MMAYTIIESSTVRKAHEAFRRVCPAQSK